MLNFCTDSNTILMAIDAKHKWPEINKRPRTANGALESERGFPTKVLYVQDPHTGVIVKGVSEQLGKVRAVFGLAG